MAAPAITPGNEDYVLGDLTRKQLQENLRRITGKEWGWRPQANIHQTGCCKKRRSRRLEAFLHYCIISNPLHRNSMICLASYVRTGWASRRLASKVGLNMLVLVKPKLLCHYIS